MGTKLDAFEDPGHEGNSAKHHTGKRCIEKACERPAGTAWSPLWCHACNVARMRRINGSLRLAAAPAAPVSSDPVTRLAAFIASRGGAVRRPSQVSVSPPPDLNEDRET